MPKQREFSALRNQAHHYGSTVSPTVWGAVAILSIGAVVLIALPEGSAQSDNPPISNAAASAPAVQGAPDDTACDQQTWPYIDQRCAQRVEAARGSRQVRIVTDKGTSVNVMTPVPKLEAKPKPAPAAPVVAQADRPIGPPVVSPQAAEPAPQTAKVAVAPQPSAPAPKNSAPQIAAAPQVSAAPPAPAPAPKVESAAAPASAPPAATNAMAMERPDQPNTRVSVVGSSVSVQPPQASAAPVAPGVNALAETRTKKFKSAREAERAAKREARREARRQRALEDEIRSARVPDETVGTVRAMPGDRRGRMAEERSTRRSRNAVPDEVIAAVEEATRGRGGRRGQIVTVETPHGGERFFVVPRERW